MSDVTPVNGDAWLRLIEGDSRSLEAAMARAVNIDHPCEDYAGCDIARAAVEGFTYVSAHLLMGATDTPTINTLMNLFPGAFEPLLRRPGGWPAGWDEWGEFHRQYGVNCPACDGYTYGDDSWTPTVCADCNADIPTVS